MPEDIAALRALALEQSRLLAEERAAAAMIALAKGTADAEIERLQAIIDAFMRHRFGPRSEQLEAKNRQVSAKSKLGEAIRYALTPWDGLSPLSR